MDGALRVALHQRDVARAEIVAQDPIGLGPRGRLVADCELEQVLEPGLLELLDVAPAVLLEIRAPRLSLAGTNERVDRDGSMVGRRENRSSPQVLAKGALELAREEEMISPLLEPLVAFDAVPDERKHAQGFGFSGRSSSQW